MLCGRLPASCVSGHKNSDARRYRHGNDAAELTMKNTSCRKHIRIIQVCAISELGNTGAIYSPHAFRAAKLGLVEILI